MKEIQISRGMTAIVDDEDFEYINSFKWSCHRDGYACRARKGQKMVYMHRLINNTPEGMQTDHLNTNKLDNRRSNLRTVTRGENNANRKSEKGSSSKFKGVRRFRNCWNAQITPIGGKTIHLGNFRNEVDAATAYNLAAAIYNSGHTRVNAGV